MRNRAVSKDIFITFPQRVKYTIHNKEPRKREVPRKEGLKSKNGERGAKSRKACNLKLNTPRKTPNKTQDEKDAGEFEEEMVEYMYVCTERERGGANTQEKTQ
jgi:hypothetical protein